MTALLLLSLALPGQFSGVAPTSMRGEPDRAPAAAPDAGPPPATLTPAQIVAALQAARPAVQACYDAAEKKNPGLAGKVVVAFTIQKDGAVGAASLKESTLGNPEAERCIVDRVHALRFFPKPAGAVSLAYGWTFERSR